MWWLSADHWAWFSKSIRTAHDHRLGWMVPATKDVLIVPRPTMRCLEDRPSVVHDDTGGWRSNGPAGGGFHFLRATAFDASLYCKFVTGQLSLQQVAALDTIDQFSIALSYMTFEQPVTKSNARLLDVGVKGTALYRLPLPDGIARDRVRRYGYDYFIHMRDASHPRTRIHRMGGPAESSPALVGRAPRRSRGVLAG